ncbi:Nitrite reductase [NAD(P)H] small subunit (EC 1.7.1.4), partial [Arthrobacter sp. DR-2P]
EQRRNGYRRPCPGTGRPDSDGRGAGLRGRGRTGGRLPAAGRLAAGGLRRLSPPRRARSGRHRGPAGGHLSAAPARFRPHVGMFHHRRGTPADLPDFPGWAAEPGAGDGCGV